MLYILTEGNKELKNRKFPIPKGIKKMLVSTFENYNGDKTIDGYKRLNNLIQTDAVSYLEMKRLKNFFDHYTGTNKSMEYILNGGDNMKMWVNNTLNTATKAVHDFKQAKKDAGISNAFIKSHEKNRQSKKKNNPTISKFSTKNANQKMLDNSILRYESIHKPNKVIIITEAQQRKLIREAKKDTFSLDVLSSLRSFSKRMAYCIEQLGGYIGKGTSRAVFQIDDEKVLKLAINEKGIAQNDAEVMTSNYSDWIMTKVFNSDQNGFWIISEFVLPAKSQDFEHCLGLNFNDFCKFIETSHQERQNTRYRSSWNRFTNEEYEELLENNEDLAMFDTFLGDNPDYPVGDLKRISSYGLAKRDGYDTIVLLDSGATDDVIRQYYSR